MPGVVDKEVWVQNLRKHCMVGPIIGCEHSSSRVWRSSINDKDLRGRVVNEAGS